MITIHKQTLPNGLTIVHSENKSTRMAALNLLYKVGARDEHPEHTGFAHLFEHLMFGGSINIPNYDTPLQNAGGENNAWTNNDITNYYLTLPAYNLELAFWLESDRMLSLDFNQRSLNIQRQIVIEEFKQRNLNQPYGDASHLMRSLAYKVHPYQWPTIGKDINHIANATLEEVKDFFYHYYAPNNAILAVTGNVSFDETMRLANKWFGPIPSRNVPIRHLPQEPKQTEARKLEVIRPVPIDTLYLCFHMCDRLHPDYYVFDMLSDILSNGKSSRLIRKLVTEKHICSSVDAYISGSLDAGLFYIVGKPSSGFTLKDVEDAIWNELELIKTTLINKHELEKVKNRYESEQIFGNINYLNVATNITYFEMISRAEDINEEVRKYRSITAEQLQRVAQETFIPENSNTLYYKAQPK